MRVLVGCEKESFRLPPQEEKAWIDCGLTEVCFVPNVRETQTMALSLRPDVAVLDARSLEACHVFPRPCRLIYLGAECPLSLPPKLYYCGSFEPSSDWSALWLLVQNAAWQAGAERMTEEWSLEMRAMERFLAALKSDSRAEPKQTVREILKVLEGYEAVSALYVRRMYVMIKMRLTEYFAAQGDEALPSAREDIRRFTFLTLPQMRERILALFAGDKEERGRIAPADGPARRAMRYIDDQLANKDLTLEDIARYAFLTPTYLASVFKKETGLTVGQYIAGARVERAKTLLADGRLRLHQISTQVGYGNADYFARVFKRHTGLSPSEYRKGRTK